MLPPVSDRARHWISRTTSREHQAASPQVVRLEWTGNQHPRPAGASDRARSHFAAAAHRSVGRPVRGAGAYPSKASKPDRGAESLSGVLLWPSASTIRSFLTGRQLNRQQTLLAPAVAVQVLLDSLPTPVQCVAGQAHDVEVIVPTSDNHFHLQLLANQMLRRSAIAPPVPSTATAAGPPGPRAATCPSVRTCQVRRCGPEGLSAAVLDTLGT